MMRRASCLHKKYFRKCQSTGSGRNVLQPVVRNIDLSARKVTECNLQMLETIGLQRPPCSAELVSSTNVWASARTCLGIVQTLNEYRSSGTANLVRITNGSGINSNNIFSAAWWIIFVFQCFLIAFYETLVTGSNCMYFLKSEFRGNILETI